MKTKVRIWVNTKERGIKGKMGTKRSERSFEVSNTNGSIRSAISKLSIWQMFPLIFRSFGSVINNEYHIDGCVTRSGPSKHTNRSKGYELRGKTYEQNGIVIFLFVVAVLVDISRITQTHNSSRNVLINFQRTQMPSINNN